MKNTRVDLRQYSAQIVGKTRARIRMPVTYPQQCIYKIWRQANLYYLEIGIMV